MFQDAPTNTKRKTFSPFLHHRRPHSYIWSYSEEHLRISRNKDLEECSETDDEDDETDVADEDSEPDGDLDSESSQETVGQ